MRYLLIIFSLFIFSCEESDENSSICPSGFSPIIGYDYDYWDNECYYNADIQVLEDFIQNSIETINIYDMELNFDGEVQWYELGHQEWDNGRLVTFISSFHYVSDPDIPYHSNLSGTIPESITNWEYIKDLRLGTIYPDDQISLEGNIDILGSLTSLERLMIFNNNFSGNIPLDIYSLINLKTLYLARNLFDGEISSDINNLTNLKHLWLGDNNFSGNLPLELWEMNHLQSIELENNNLNGTIPTVISNMDSLYRLVLNNNNFYSTIPNEICDLENLINNLGLPSEEWYGEPFDYFNISDNNFCPDSLTSEYPSCIEPYIGEQDCSYNFNFNVNEHKISNKFYKEYKKTFKDNSLNKNLKRRVPKVK